MSDEVIFNTVEEFVAGVKELGINKLAFAETKERRAECVEGESSDDSPENSVLNTVLDVILVKRVELLTYKDGIIYKCIINDEEADDIYNRLAEDGFGIERRSRNII